MAVSSLPSPYGIGTLGKAAYDFVDFLKAAGQSYWQMLPLNPTSYGDPLSELFRLRRQPLFHRPGYACQGWAAEKIRMHQMRLGR